MYSTQEEGPSRSLRPKASSVWEYFAETQQNGGLLSMLFTYLPSCRLSGFGPCLVLQAVILEALFLTTLLMERRTACTSDEIHRKKKESNYRPICLCVSFYYFNK